MARKSARTAAMQLVYERLLGGCGDDTLTALIGFEPDEEDARYIQNILNGVSEHAEELDTLVASHSPSRELDRIARVDLSILRVALYEMLYGDSPTAVVIDEAVSLSNRFSEPADSRFINGVLGQIAHRDDV